MPPPNNNQAATTNYNTAFGEFGSVYDPQVQQLQSQQAQLLQQKNTTLDQMQQDNTTKLSQLDQAKANAFSNNALTSNARGLFYSGYVPKTNNDYTVNTYNPNVQAQNTNYQRGADSTNTTYTQNNQSLADKITALNQSRANDANSLVMNTKQAQIAAAKTAATARTAASTKAAKAAQPTANSISNAIRLNLSHATGQDGFVSPEDYAAAYIDWLNNGQSSSSFNSQFGAFKNPSNKYYSYAITNALKRT